MNRVRGFVPAKGKTVLASACLLGIRSRYDGKSAIDRNLMNRLRGVVIIPVCPEQLGGLPTPRPKMEIEKGAGADVLEKISRVRDAFGIDTTKKMLRGARETLEIARLGGAKRAYLKEKSPSCGVRYIVRNGKRTRGMGVTAALLKKKGINAIGV
jgi:uncharacterized protein YbbK (DUF523 family)